MSNITFFAKRRFFHVRDGHLMRGSSIIRGEQTSEYLGAKLNPASGYEEDICIYVKPHSLSLYANDIKLAKYSYIDIIDGFNLVMFLRKTANIPVIACSLQDQEYLSQILTNKIYFIPQHSCNFERVVRDRKEITTVGMIGNEIGNKYLPENFARRIEQLGLKFITYSNFKRRTDIINFYKQIDIQLVWRPWKKKLSNPLKLVNASSFGIPTIALYESAFKEFEGYYIPVRSIDEMIEQIQNLVSSNDLYDEYSKKSLIKSEEYYISNVVELYKKLETY